jgi:hypothetical protein
LFSAFFGSFSGFSLTLSLRSIALLSELPLFFLDATLFFFFSSFGFLFGQSLFFFDAQPLSFNSLALFFDLFLNALLLLSDLCGVFLTNALSLSLSR